MSTPEIPFGASALVTVSKFFTQRGISNEVADRMGYVYLTQDATAKFLGYPSGSDAILLPYYDQSGAPVIDERDKFARLRLLQKTGSGKYMQKTGSHTHARLTPNCRWDWGKVGRNADVPVMFTEGEFKADAANRDDIDWDGEGVATVGLGGVDSWKGNGTGKPLVPEIDGWVWEGRQVYVCFDYDGKDEAQGYKREVWAAIERLGVAMSALGAQVSVVHLRKTDTAVPGEKLGLDDYILQGGRWSALKSTQEPFQPLDGRMLLLQRFGLFRGDPIDLTTGEVRPFSKWINAEMGSYFFVDAKGERKQAYHAWKMEPKRVIVEDFILDPLRPFGLGRDGLFNRWKEHSGVTPLRNDEITRDWEVLVQGVLGEELCDTFHQWAAWSLQHPEAHNFTSWFVVSPEGGIGKSLIGETLAQAAGSRGYFGGPDSLHDEFNAHMVEGHSIIVINELGEGKVDYRKFKNLRTADRLNVNEKFQPRYTTRNFMNFYVTTNEMATHKVSKAERRDIVVRVGGSALTPAWKTWLSSGVAKRLLSDAGAAAVLDYYLRVDCSGWNRAAPAPMTEAKARMAEATESAAEALAREIVEAVGSRGLVTNAAIRAVCRGTDDRTVKKHIRHHALWHSDEVVFLDGRTQRCLAWNMGEGGGEWLTLLGSKVEETRRGDKLVGEVGDIG